jgi:hypothetical protein
VNSITSPSSAIKRKYNFACKLKKKIIFDDEKITNIILILKLFNNESFTSELKYVFVSSFYVEKIIGNSIVVEEVKIPE